MNKKYLIAIVVCIIALVSYCDGNNESAPDNYVESIRNNDFKSAHEILDKKLNRAVKLNASDHYNAEEAQEDFWAAADHIYKTEIMYLVEMNDTEANKRLLKTFAMMNVIGDKPQGKVSAYSSISKYKNYSIFVTRFNRLCDEVLNISILNKNKEMAETILALYKEDCSAPYKKDGDDGHYYFDFSYSSKEAADKKFREAVENGTLE